MLANGLTILRILLVAPISLAILNGHGRMALVLLVIAAVTDGLDGRVARHFGTTVLGSWLDVTADRLVIVTVAVSLWWVEALPQWIAAVLLGREAAVALGALIAYAPSGPMEPLRIGKAHTVATFCLLVLVLAAKDGVVPPIVIELVGVIVAVTAVGSLAGYGWRLRA